MRQNIWELRGKYSEAKNSKNSPEFTETVFSSEVCSITHKRMENSENDEIKVTDLPTNMAEMVVFDDIEDTWREENIAQKRTEEEQLADTSSMYNSSNTECGRVTKIIGNLPIAVYEGSPRRYGVRSVENSCSSHPQLPSAQSLLASPSVYPPRPGFPQRIVCTPSGNEQTENLDVSISNSIFNLPFITAKSPISRHYRGKQFFRFLNEFVKFYYYFHSFLQLLLMKIQKESFFISDAFF